MRLTHRIRKIFGSRRVRRRRIAASHRNAPAAEIVEALEPRELLSAVSLSLSAGTATEGASKPVAVWASTDEPVIGDQTVELNISGDGISSADYALSATTITIPDGSRSGHVTLDVIDDSTVENAEEQLALSLSNPSAGLELSADAEFVFTIRDNDSAEITLNAADVLESAGIVQFTISLSNPVDVDVTAQFATTDGSATAGSEYSAHAQTVTLVAGTTTATVAVPILDDDVVEDNTAFRGEVLSVQAGDGDDRRDIGFHRQSLFSPGLLVGDVVDSQWSPDGNAVVYIADQNTDEQFELFSVPAGGGTPIRLNSEPVADGDVSRFEFTPDGRTVVFLGDMDADNVDELYSVSASGGQITKLNPLMPFDRDVTEFKITPDGQHVVFLANLFVDQQFELFSVPITGGAATRLNGSVVPGGSVESFKISRHNNRVVYLADQDRDDRFELYRVDVTGGPAFKLNGPVTSGGDVIDFEISPNAVYAVYIADLDSNNEFELYSTNIVSFEVTKLNEEPFQWYHDVKSFQISPDSSKVVYTQTRQNFRHLDLLSVPITGGAQRIISSADVLNGGIESFTIAATGDRVLYIADASTGDTEDLYSTHITNGEPFRLNAPIAHPQDVNQFQLNSDGTRAVYLTGFSDVSGPDQLFSVPVTGGGDVVSLSIPSSDGGEIQQFEVSASGADVVYISDERLAGSHELFRTPINGGVASRLSGPLTEGGDVSEFTIAADGTRLTYIANADVAHAQELFSMAVAGGEVSKLNGPLPLGGQLSSLPDNISASADHRRIFYLNQADVFYEVSAEGGDPVRISPDGMKVSSYVLTADGQTAVVRATLDDGPSQIFAISLAGRTVTQLNAELADNGFIVNHALSPDGRRVVYLVNQGPFASVELFSVPIEGGAAIRLNPDLPPQGDVTSIERISPDGRFLIFTIRLTSSGRKQFYSVPVAGGPPVFLHDMHVFGFEFTSNNSQIVARAAESASADAGLYAIPLDGRPITRLDDPNESDGGPVYYFQVASNGDVYYATSRLMKVSVSGGTPQPVIADFPASASMSNFILSPDERYIAYLADALQTDRLDLFSVSLNDGTVTLLALQSEIVNVRHLYFSPDSRTVVTRSNRDDLFSVPVEGGSVQRLNFPEKHFRQNLPSVGFTDDSKQIVFWNDGRQDSAFDLFSTALTGGPVTEHTPFLEDFKSVRQWRPGLLLDDKTVYFTQDDAFIQSLRATATANIIDDDSSVPNLTGPFGTLAETNPTITWRGVDGAVNYDVSLERVNDPGVTEQANVTETSYRIVTPLGIGDYRIQVVARFGDGSTTTPRSTQIRINGTVAIDSLPGHGVDTRPVISWNSLPFASRYEIWANNLTTGEVAVIRDTNVSTNSYIPPSDLTFGRYRIWVRGIDAAGVFTNWSEAVDYSLGPQPVAPVRPSFNRRPTFEWTDIPEASTYELWVVTSEGSLNPKGLSQPSWTSATDLPGGILQWWVRGLSASGRPGRWSQRADADIDRPVVTGPSHATATSSPLITWTNMEGAAHYDLFIYRTDIPGLAYRNRNVPTAEFGDVILADGTYKAWVRPTDQQGNARLWSRPLDFTVAGGIPTTALKPLEVTRDARPEFEWLPVVGARSYEFYLTDGTTIINETGLTSPSFTPTTDLAPGTWDWWVRSIDNTDTASGWTARNEFNVAVRVLSPTSTISDGAPILTWTPADISITSGYEVYVDRIDVAGFVHRENVSWGDNSLQLPPLKSGDYRAWVRAIGPFSTPFPWSGVAEFSVDAGDLSVAPTSPLIESVFGPPTFEWTTAAGAASYDVYIRRGSNFIYQRGITETSWTPEAGQLSVGVDVAWYVRAVAADGTPGEWSDATVIDIAQIKSTVLTNGTLSTDPLPAFSWTAIDDVEFYEISISGGSTFIRTFTSVVRGTSIQPEFPFADGNYTVRVRPWKTADVVGAWSDPASVTLTSAGSLTVQPTGTTRTLNAQPTLSWPSVDGAAGYEVIIHNGEIGIHGQNIATAAWSPEVPLALGQWRWAVRVVDSSGNVGSWSRFDAIVHIGDARSTITAPTATSSSMPTFQWTAVDGADMYVLHVEDDEGSVVIRQDNLTDLSYVATIAFPAGEYRAWVRAINSIGLITGPWSAARSFRVV